MRLMYFAGTVTFAGALLVCCAAHAWDQDPFAQYLQRSTKITLGAGNAKEVNAATHVIDPWPPNVGNRRIPANGERMVGAIERYQDVRRLRQGPLPLSNPVPPFGGGAAGAGGGAGGGGIGGAAQ
jgi:hypothetical protein